MDVDGGGRGGEIMQRGTAAAYISHSGKSINGEYSGVRREHRGSVIVSV